MFPSVLVPAQIFSFPWFFIISLANGKSAVYFLPVSFYQAWLILSPSVCCLLSGVADSQSSPHFPNCTPNCVLRRLLHPWAPNAIFLQRWCKGVAPCREIEKEGRGRLKIAQQMLSHRHGLARAWENKQRKLHLTSSHLNNGLHIPPVK